MLYWNQFCSAPLAPPTTAGYAAAVKPGKNRSAKTNNFFNSFNCFPYTGDLTLIQADFRMCGIAA